MLSSISFTSISQFSKCRSSASSRRFIPRYFILFDTMLKVKVAQSCLTLCNPMDYTLHGILEARILEWVAFSFSRDLPNPGLLHCRQILYQLNHKGSLCE